MIFNENIIFNFLGEKKLDKAREYMASCIPDTLSKFYSLTDDTELNEKKLSCLADDCNWYENPINQNDPFDMRMGFIDEAHAKKAGLPQHMVDFEKRILNGLVEQMLLCSFVDSDYNNLPMWAYYANNHQGYCLNYKINRKKIFFKVIYQKNKIRMNEVFLAELKMLRSGNGREDTQVGREILAYIVAMIFSLKHGSWKHEKEYRILVPCDEAGGMRMSNMEFGLEVNDITIGLKCKLEYKERIMKIAKDRKIKCYQLCTDEKKFLSRQLINL